MSWILLTVAAVGSRAAYSIASKLLSRNLPVSAFTQAAVLTGVAGLLTLPLLPLLGGLRLEGLQQSWPMVMLMVGSQGLGNVLFFAGISRLDAGTTQIAFSSILLWGLGLSVAVLDSSFSVTQLIGAAVLLIAVMAAQYGPVDRSRNIGVAYIMASAALFALFQVASAELSKTMTTATYLLVAYVGSTALIAAFHARGIRADMVTLLQEKHAAVVYVGPAAAMTVLYFAFAYYAYRLAPDPGIVVVLLTTQVVLSVLLGALLLGEKQHLGRKCSAAVLALIGATLVAR